MPAPLFAQNSWPYVLLLPYICHHRRQNYYAMAGATRPASREIKELSWRNRLKARKKSSRALYSHRTLYVNRRHALRIVEQSIFGLNSLIIVIAGARLSSAGFGRSISVIIFDTAQSSAHLSVPRAGKPTHARESRLRHHLKQSSNMAK